MHVIDIAPRLSAHYRRYDRQPSRRDGYLVPRRTDDQYAATCIVRLSNPTPRSPLRASLQVCGRPECSQASRMNDLTGRASGSTVLR